MPRSQRASLLIAALGAASTLMAMPGRAAEAAPVAPQVAQNAEADPPPATQQPTQAAPPRSALIPATPAQRPPLEVELRADSQGFDLMANRYVAVGNVRALLAGGRLLADRLEYDTATRTIVASGRVRFQRGSHYLQASRLRYSLIENSGELEEAYGVLDLDSSALDLNPATPPSVELLPLSYWERLRPPFDEPITLLNPLAEGSIAERPLNRGAKPLPASNVPPDAAVTATALALDPLANPATAQALGLPAPLSGLAEGPAGTPEPLAGDPWRMPPVALSPAAQTMACPPPLPPLPDWHPYPWAATLWGGQMIDANFGDTFIFKGQMRPEYLLGLGLNRRLLRAGPLALEFDSNAMLHRAARQAGGEFNQSVPFADTPAQTFGEFTWGFGLRAWLQPWLSLGFVEGVSLNTNVSNYERTFREDYTTFLNYLGFEVEALVAPEWSLVGRIHHRSGAYGTYSGVSEGSNAYLLGLRYRYGAEAPKQLGVAMAPPDGCPNGAAAERQRPRPLSEQLNQVALGPASQATATPAAAPQSPARSGGLSPAAQEALRREAIAATVDQRVQNLQFQQSLTADRRFGARPEDYDQSAAEVAYGAVRPVQLKPILVKGNNRLVTGTISRWRMQANRISVSPEGWRADRAAFTNDPYTPAQVWVDAEGVVARLEANGDLAIQAQRNQLILEDRLPIPLQRNQRFEKQQEVENRWVLASDGEDRDGFYLGYNLKPISVGKEGTLSLQPQFMVRRALDGSTDSYVLPGEPIGASPSSQPTRIGDLFGLLARYDSSLFGFQVQATADISTFDPSNFADGTRSWGDLRRSFTLPLLGETTARGFAAYRYRVWNGSLGEQDVYSAVGVSLEQQRTLPNWGRLSNQLFWRAGVGNFQGTEYQSSNLADLWRGSVYASLNSSLPLWTGKAVDTGSESASRFSPVPIVPGLVLNANTSLNLAYYGDGTYQNLYSISGGPTLTLGHLQRNWFDYTQLTITGGGTLREGLSPFSFDREVDLGTVGIGLTQQLVGPLLFSGGLGLNVDPRSEFFGDTVGAYVELRWQRRAYELAVYYSPYEQLGGIRVKLNDFNFSGTGVPFVPYNPVVTANDPATLQRRGF
ncbi:MAG: DUF3769 domain-containing protein [Vulcanococcus sp.]